ncbi:MAG: hypothetical protein U0521_20795 [Anaerolineae bacterium]
MRAGSYDMQKGSVAVLDPRGVEIDEKLTFTAISAPSEAPFYPPPAWSADSTFVRVPIPTATMTAWRCGASRSRMRRRFSATSRRRARGCRCGAARRSA